MEKHWKENHYNKIEKQKRPLIIYIFLNWINKKCVLISMLLLDDRTKNKKKKGSAKIPKQARPLRPLPWFSSPSCSDHMGLGTVLNSCFRFPGPSMFPAWCTVTAAPLHTIRTCSLIASARICNPISVWTEPNSSAQRGLWVLCGWWGGAPRMGRRKALVHSLFSAIMNALSGRIHHRSPRGEEMSGKVMFFWLLTHVTQPRQSNWSTENVMLLHFIYLYGCLVG